LGDAVAEDYRHKVICDPVHGDIGLSALEEQVIDSPSFQRLRNLKQLGLATLVYPNASHSRFAHSLGVFRIIDLLVDKGKFTDDDRRIMRIAALVHDIGHYPYSHLMEFVDRDRHRASYMHKTIFGFEALLRHILFLLREHGLMYRDGTEIESLVLKDEFLDFHDSFVDGLLNKYAQQKTPKSVVPLCKALKERKPPKLVHEVAVLSHHSQGTPSEYALFVKDRAKRVKELESTFKIANSRWIWEDPKDVKFESLGPFVALSEAPDITPDETAELIRVRMRDGSIRPLVEDKNSIVHHLSQLSRLYVVGPVSDADLLRIQQHVQSWTRQD
jgi:HD superfamily phosphohydrolase